MAIKDAPCPTALCRAAKWNLPIGRGMFLARALLHAAMGYADAERMDIPGLNFR
jgi:hypothetical protein